VIFNADKDNVYRLFHLGEVLISGYPGL